jgi:hypothetical protein
MTDGPYEYVVIVFPDGGFCGELVPALVDLVGFGTVRILDLVVIQRRDDGSFVSMEIDELDDESRELFYDLDGEYDGLLSAEDIELAAQEVSPGSSAVVIIWEDLWAANFADAIRRASGDVIVSERLPRDVVRRAMESLASA